MTIIKIPLALLPDMRSFFREYGAELADIEAVYPSCEDSPELERRLAACAAEEITANHPAYGLRCRLSPYFITANKGFALRPSRTAMERTVCRTLVEQEAPAEGVFFSRDWLDQVSAATGGRSIRASGVGTLPDRCGHHALYPDAACIDPGLIQLASFTHRFQGEHPLTTAIVSSSLLLNIHPLQDGNGRLTRILFNFILQSALGTRFYLPLCDLHDASAGGWTFAQRSAWMKGDWRPLVSFYGAAIRLFAR